MEFYIGSICTFGFNFAPVGWAMCNGQTLPISQYQALFTLIGTTYGGDGVSTFAVPDLRSRVPIGVGQGPGLSNYALGQKAGNANLTLTTANLAAHTHPGTAKIAVGTGSDTSNPSNIYFGTASNTQYASSGPNPMGGGTAVPTTAMGGSQPINILSPMQGVNYCIAVEGIYPQHP